MNRMAIKYGFDKKRQNKRDTTELDSSRFATQRTHNNKHTL